MVEILHQLICSFSHYLQDILYIPGGAGFYPSTELRLHIKDIDCILIFKETDMIQSMCCDLFTFFLRSRGLPNTDTCEFAAFEIWWIIFGDVSCPGPWRSFEPYAGICTSQHLKDGRVSLFLFLWVGWGSFRFVFYNCLQRFSCGVYWRFPRWSKFTVTNSVTILPSLKLTVRTWKRMVGRRSFPFRMAATWKVLYLSVSFRECSMCIYQCVKIYFLQSWLNKAVP